MTNVDSKLKKKKILYMSATFINIYFSGKTEIIQLIMDEILGTSCSMWLLSYVCECGF